MEYRLAEFEKLRGERFEIRSEQGLHEVVLEEVTRLPPPPPDWGGRQEPFSLLFRSEQPPILPQASYPLLHQELGQLPPIFLVPLSSREGCRYEAIFN